MKRESVQREIVIREQIARGLVTVRARAEEAEGVGAHCFALACEGQRLGKWEYVAEMLKISADLEVFAADLRLLALEMESDAIITAALKGRLKIPRMISCCEQALAPLTALACRDACAEGVADCLDKVRARLRKLRGRSRIARVPLALEDDFGARSRSVAPAYQRLLEAKKKKLERAVALAQGSEGEA